MRYRSFVRFTAEAFEGLAVTVAVLVTWPISKRWLRNWGSRLEERNRAWLGDELVLPEATTYTRAVSIAAPPSDVWPWLVQFGLRRAGFYSYELIERMVGIPVKNVESVVPQYQSLAVGDEILLHPNAPGIPVAAVEPERHICFGIGDDREDPEEKPDPNRSWSMYLVPEAGTSSRLLLRGCIEPLREPTFLKRLGSLVEEPVDFIMEQRMLRTVKRLAQASPGQGQDSAISS